MLDPRTPPAQVVGEMVHKALQHWRFPDDPLLEKMLRAKAQMEGLLDERLIQQAIQVAKALLQHLQGHPLFAEIDTAIERHHEVPFIGVSAQGNAQPGFMDCFFRTQEGWILVDFKTDELKNRQALLAAQEMYTPQILRYRQAVEKWLGIVPKTLLCFLNVERTIEIVEVI